MSNRVSTRARLAGAFIAGVMTAGINGCSLTPDDLPSVRAGVNADYTITLQFANILNLPRGADVVMNGLRVGTVESTSQTPQGVDVVAGVAAGTRIPTTTTAIIRQNTLLGDTYVALTPGEEDTGAAGFLGDNGIVSLDKTTSPPPLEDTIAVLAYFVNGGTIQKVQDTMATLNQTMPAIGEVRDLAATVSIDLTNLSQGTTQIDRLLAGLDETSNVFTDRRKEIEAVFSDDGVHYFTGVAKSAVAHISTLLPSIGSVFIGGLWLVPMLESAADLVESGRGEFDAATSAEAASTVTGFLQNTLLPWASRPQVNIRAVKASDSDTELVDDATTILRMLGALR